MMKLSEITDKERFKNRLKDPKLEKVRQGMEKLSKIFNDDGWYFDAKLDDEIYWMRITHQNTNINIDVDNVIAWSEHIGVIKTVFPRKHVERHFETDQISNTFTYSISVYKDFDSEKQ